MEPLEWSEPFGPPHGQRLGPCRSYPLVPAGSRGLRGMEDSSDDTGDWSPSSASLGEPEEPGRAVRVNGRVGDAGVAGAVNRADFGRRVPLTSPAGRNALRSNPVDVEDCSTVDLVA